MKDKQNKKLGQVSAFKKKQRDFKYINVYRREVFIKKKRSIHRN